EGALTGAFEFEDQPPFAGFRQLASAGLDLPVLNVFRMFGKMSGQQLAVESSAGLNADIIRAKNVRGNPDISAEASLDVNKKQLAVLIWYYHDDDLPGPDADIDLALDGLPVAHGKVKVTHYRIDATHSNSYQAWLLMGSPEPLTEKQRTELEQAGKLTELEPPKELTVKDSSIHVPITLPRQGVSLL